MPPLERDWTWEILNVENFVLFEYVCPRSAPAEGVLRISNHASAGMHVFVDSGGADPAHQWVFPEGLISVPAAATGDSYVIHTRVSGRAATFWVATVNSDPGCDAQVFGIGSAG
jgi:hypothetical protein